MEVHEVEKCTAGAIPVLIGQLYFILILAFDEKLLYLLSLFCISRGTAHAKYVYVWGKCRGALVFSCINTNLIF